ncbi:hypothetical protein CGJ15_24525 [Vibrio parahaemolyticus]|nr:hypothetical protein CGJ15_24525 [Vibrio parahaemolyticus]
MSGLVNVYARPDGLSSSVDGLNPGTTGNVVITYSASCCTSQVDIIGVDSLGNVGKCIIDMGVQGGMIIDLEALSVGQTWVYLTWTLTPTDYEVHKYSIVINDDFTQDSRCKDSVCYANVTELEACSLQTFQVTPYFTVAGSDQMGEPAYTNAYTTDEVPGTPQDGVVVSIEANTATITWAAINSKCISQYQVCYKAVDSVGSRVCEQTSATSYDMLGLEACTQYEVNVTSLSPTGLTSASSLIFDVETILAPPGLPRNVQTALSLPDAITVTWDNPLENAHCIQKFAVSITVKVTSALTELLMKQQREVHMVAADSDNTFTIYNLEPCTNYTIEVVAIAWDDSLGPSVQSDSATAETNPDPVWELATKEVTTVSMEVTWEAAIICVDHFKICYYDEEEVTEKCEVVTEPSVTLTDLLPCVDYFVSVTAASYSDYYSTAVWQTRRTLDIAPGTPENLIVTSKTAHSIEIDFDPPSDSPQCVAEYVNSIVELDDVTKGSEFLFYQQRGYTFDNLDACTHYEIKVCARSSELQASSWAVVNDTTDEDVPTEPQSFVVRDATTTSLTVAWWTPENNSRCVDSYELEWTNPSGETNSETITHVPGTSLPFVVEKEITNLDPCTEYSLKVWTITASGSVGPSTALTASTEC